MFDVLMKKILLLFLLCFLLIHSASSQQFGNEWINYSQKYYKVYVHENGVYRLSYNALLNAGVPVGSIDPRSFQVFNKGTEQYIYVHGENDGVFHNTDYIEFYGERNDGSLDTELYNHPSSQANNAYSLFNDSSVYFVTWNSSISNRRMTPENDVNFSAYLPVPYVFVISRQNYTSKYFAGETNTSGMTDPMYTSGEGWFDNEFNLGQSVVKNIPTTNKYSSGPPANVEFVLVGASNYAFLSPDHHVRIQFANISIDTLFDGYKLLKYNYSLSLSQLGSSSTSFTFSSINDLGSGSDRNTVAYIQIKYAHTLNFDGASNYTFYAQDAVQAKSLLNISSFSANPGDTVRLYDLTNHLRVKVLPDGANYKSLLPNTGNEKKCFITSDNNIVNVVNIIPVAAGGSFINYQSIANVERSDYLIVTHSSLWTEAENYKNYRNSSGYKALLVDIDQLYDQHAYGILKSPLAIRNFVRLAWNHFTEKPRHLFLVGKAYRAASDGSYPQYRTSSYYNNLTLVPSFGYPPSDVLYSQGIIDTLYEPAVPTGRLSARIPNHVSLYLSKVQQYESAQLNPEEWMKTILHFGGGTSENEQSTFKGYLSVYENIIEDTLFGGNVIPFYKTSSAPIQINQSDSLRYLINNGVTMMTFFGHAAGIGFDQSIDNPSEYSNYGKYPFLLANSCYAGDIFLEGSSSSEEFVLIENKGVIGYLASIYVGIPWALNTYSNELYQNIGFKSYGKSIGECIKNTINTIQSPDLTLKETALTMTLHGDPAVILNSFEKPDYMVNQTSVFFDPPELSSEIDSFYVNIVSTNLGRAISDSFIVQTIRTYSDGASQNTYLTKIKAPLFKDTIILKMPLDLASGIGLNKIKVTLDYFNEIDELTKTNNTTEVTFFIKSTDVIPVFPYKYAIIPSLPVTLKASTGFPFLGSNTYVFELDTTDYFNSPVKQTHTITQSGGVLQWTPVFPISSDSIVYYWRVSIDSNASHGYNWRESSFQYIQGKNGWGQAHFYQFKNDVYQYVNFNRPQRKFDFVNTINSLSCQTGFYPYIPWNEEWYKINNVVKSIWAYLGPTGNGMCIAVFDSLSGNPWVNYSYPDVQYRWEFSCHDSVSREAMRSFMQSVPVGNYVLGFSHRNHYAQEYSEDVYQEYESIGSSAIRTLPDNIPYAIFGKKGSNIGDANEMQGTSISSIIKLNDSIPTRWYEGYIESEMIGPASNWGSLHWREVTNEPEGLDTVSLTAIGYNLAGMADTVFHNLPPDSGDIFNLSARIDAAQYPFMKLIVYMKDDTLHTPAQMRRWQVLFEGAPETALDPSAHFYFHKDTLNEGETLVLSTATRNISQYNMDSILIKYWVVDKNRVSHPVAQKRLRAHPAGDLLPDTIRMETSGFGGLNSLWIEVNPDNDQLEQYHFNNIGELYFYVHQDRTNPLLDVTFDGVHILDGDIVSARPEIQISLKDENKFLALNDTASFRVYMQYPDNPTLTRVYFYSGGLEQMQFIPASLPNNSCKIVYKADFPTDGTYKLIIEAQDISRNESGTNDFSVSFEIINKATITSVMNWPNPFTTATHFVFTLTGSETPTYFKIQIMTVTGKVVREIDLSELGSIHIGRNITEYAWDGTDQFGDRLANGVYLYRVITRLNEEKIELNPTQADQYFKRAFGKMYLMGN